MMPGLMGGGDTFTPRASLLFYRYSLILPINIVIPMTANIKVSDEFMEALKGEQEEGETLEEALVRLLEWERIEDEDEDEDEVEEG